MFFCCVSLKKILILQFLLYKVVIDKWEIMLID